MYIVYCLHLNTKEKFAWMDLMLDCDKFGVPSIDFLETGSLNQILLQRSVELTSSVIMSMQ